MYYCGLDGGGTKTALCAIDTEGRVIGETVLGPMNLNGAKRETVQQTVMDALDYMAHSLPGGSVACGGLTIGMAGASNRTLVCFMQEAFREYSERDILQLVGDQEIALNGAIQGKGAVLVAGTGSVCCGRDENGRIYRSGGYGYLIDDVGSGYAIGRDILTAVVRAWDGRMEATCLTEAVFRQLGIRGISELITWLYAPTTGKKEVAALAPLLVPALEINDPAAVRIAESAAADLAELVFALWRTSGLTGGELALTGGVLTHYPLIASRLTEIILGQLPDIDIHAPYHTPAYGAAMMAMANAGRRAAL